MVETPEAAVQEELTKRQHLRNLLQMEAIDSIGDAFDWETNTVRRQTDVDFRAMGEAGGKPESSDVGDKVLVAGDVTINRQADKEAPPPEKTNGLGTLGKVALGTALVAGGVGAGAAANHYLNPSADTNTITDVEFPE
jgi:hypothetical protein